MSSTRPDTPKFRGFRSPNYTQVPDELFDELLVDLSGAELKVLLYIIRRTFGFKRDSDNISLSQMLQGIQTRDGRLLDRGVGLSKKTLLQALRSLEEQNIILTERRQSPEKGNEPTSYQLNMLGSDPGGDVLGGETTPPLGEKLHQGGGNKTTPSPWGRNYTTQETVIQQTVKQHTGTSNVFDSDSEIFNSAKPSGLSKATRTRAQSEPHRDATGSPPGENSPDQGKQSRGERGFASIGHILTYHQAQTLASADKEERPQRKTAPRRPKTARTAAYIPEDGAKPQRRREPPPEAPEWLRRLATDLSHELHDPSHIEQNIGQAARLWMRTGCEDSRFHSKWNQARRETLKRKIDKPSRDHPGMINKAPYFFKVLRDMLGAS